MHEAAQLIQKSHSNQAPFCCPTQQIFPIEMTRLDFVGEISQTMSKSNCGAPLLSNNWPPFENRCL